MTDRAPKSQLGPIVSITASTYRFRANANAAIASCASMAQFAAANSVEIQRHRIGRGGDLLPAKANLFAPQAGPDDMRRPTSC